MRCGDLRGDLFDYDISMALMRDSDLDVVIADFGLSLVDLFYAFAGTCLFVGLRQKGDRYKLLSGVALGIGISMPLIFYTNDAGWDVRPALADDPTLCDCDVNVVWRGQVGNGD